MPVLAFLRGLVVVRGGGENCVDSGTCGNLFRFFDRLMGCVGGRAGDDRHASGGDFNGGVDYEEPFVVGESGSLAGGAAGYKKVDSRLELPRHQVAQGSVVDGAILTKGSYECSAAATELHRNRIARVGAEGKSGE